MRSGLSGRFPWQPCRSEKTGKSESVRGLRWLNVMAKRIKRFRHDKLGSHTIRSSANDLRKDRNGLLPLSLCAGLLQGHLDHRIRHPAIFSQQVKAGHADV